jgi:hypothetical protein
LDTLNVKELPSLTSESTDSTADIIVRSTLLKRIRDRQVSPASGTIDSSTLTRNLNGAEQSEADQDER